MADIISSNALLDDEEKKKQEQAQSTPDAMSGTGTSGVVTGGNGSNALASGNSQSQPWTNIQAYLSANKDDGSSSKLLTDNVQPGLDKEIDRYGNESKSSLDAGKSQADNAASAYNEFAPNVDSSASGAGNQDYASKARSILQNAYKSNPFTFSTDNQVKTYGDNLKNDDTFYNQQNDFYKKAAGGSLSSGQGALQTQLDVNNENLANTRSNLLKKYSGFQDGLDSNIKGVNDNLAQYEQAYNTNKNALNDSARSQYTNFNNAYNKHSADLDQYQIGRANDLAKAPSGRSSDDGGLTWSSPKDRINKKYDDLTNAENTSWNPKNNQWNYIKSILGGG